VGSNGDNASSNFQEDMVCCPRLRESGTCNGRV